MDRLDEIKHCWSIDPEGLSESHKVMVDHMNWAIDEIERLRKIEDAARVPYYGGNEVSDLIDVLDDNPRPGS